MISWILEVVWRHRLKDYFTGKQNKIIKVLGWRTALINNE